MELATVSYFRAKLSLEERLAMIRDTGFGTISIWGEYPAGSGYLGEAGLERVSGLAERFGLAIHSMHAPFARANDLFSEDVAARDRLISEMIENIRACASLGAGVLIVHFQRSGANTQGKEAMILSGLRELLPELRRTGVRIALENLLSAKSVRMLDALLPELPEEFGMCYDSSHDNISGDPLSILSRWGTRILTTHISDNHGVMDEHLLPWEGSIDWDAVVRAFPWDTFPGPLLMESEMVASAVKDPAEFLRQVWERGQRLLSMR